MIGGWDEYGPGLRSVGPFGDTRSQVTTVSLIGQDSEKSDGGSRKGYLWCHFRGRMSRGEKETGHRLGPQRGVPGDTTLYMRKEPLIFILFNRKFLMLQ